MHALPTLIVCPSCDQRIARFQDGGLTEDSDEAVAESYRCPNCGPFIVFAPTKQGWRGAPVTDENTGNGASRHQHRSSAAESSN